MAFVIGIDTLGTVAEADAYFAQRPQGERWATFVIGNTKENALRMAYRHLRGLYEWRDDVVFYPNAQTAWYPSLRPAVEVTDPSIIPDEEKWSQYELALQWAIADQMMPAANYLTSSDPDGGQQLKSKKLGPLQKEYYENQSLMFSLAEGQMKAKVYPLIDLYLQDFVWGRMNSNAIKLAV